MKSLLVCFVFIFFLTFQACSPSQSDENKKRRDEIIAVHDEVMPKMGQLKNLEKIALQKAEELSMSSESDSSKVQDLKDLALQLDQAYEGMFVWMRQYEVEDGEKTPEEIKAYLEDQMVLVSDVNKKMKEALSKADSLLKN